MLPRSNGLAWMEEQEQEEDDAVSCKDDDMTLNMNMNMNMHNPSLATFKSIHENDWYLNNNPDMNMNIINFCSDPTFPTYNNNNNNLLLCSNPTIPMDSSSPSCFSSLFNALSQNSFENSFDLGYPNSFLPNPNPNPSVFMGYNAPLSSQTQLGTSGLSSNSEFVGGGGGCGFNPIGFEGFDCSGNSSMLLPNRSKVLKPLEASPTFGAQPTLFQKRAAAALRQSSCGTHSSGGGDHSGFGLEMEKKRKREDEDGLSFDGSGFNYDSDEDIEQRIKEGENVNNDGENGNGNVMMTGGDGKGKKTGMPAKNLMAERRRRKKLNDRLYMLRSVVPKISKMDRASILGDAIDYLKELLQRINDLHNELEATPPSSFPPPTTSFHPLTPTPPTLPYRVKEELCANSMPSPKNQSARVEVRVREGRAVNIHMFCARRPGLLLSTMRALDNLGLDIQQAVISCFNGFALDVFRAEQCIEGQDVMPEQIKAVLLDSAGFHGVM